MFDKNKIYIYGGEKNYIHIYGGEKNYIHDIIKDYLILEPYTCLGNFIKFDKEFKWGRNVIYVTFSNFSWYVISMEENIETLIQSDPILKEIEVYDKMNFEEGNDV